MLLLAGSSSPSFPIGSLWELSLPKLQYVQKHMFMDLECQGRQKRTAGKGKHVTRCHESHPRRLWILYSCRHHLDAHILAAPPLSCLFYIPGNNLKTGKCISTVFLRMIFSPPQLLLWSFWLSSRGSFCFRIQAHSGLVGGGLAILGSNFFIAFLAFYGTIICIRVGKNTNNHLERSKSVLNTWLFWPKVSIFPLYFIVAHFHAGRLGAASQTSWTTFLVNLGPKLNL